MKIEKVIFSVDDNPLYADFWPIQAKLVRDILNAEPILFYITNEDSDFYFDGHGTVKKINGKNYNTSYLSQIVRMYGTKYFPDEICLTADIDMLMLNREYFIEQIKSVDDDSLVIFDSKGYDIERPECRDLSLHSHERYPICYNAAKGKTFNKILNTDREFKEYCDELHELKLGWSTDEIYFARCVDNKDHGINVVKLIRGKTSPWITEKRIERHNFPINHGYLEELRLNDIYGSYDPSKLGDYIDAHCPRPYSEYKGMIDSLVSKLEKSNTSTVKYLRTSVEEDKVFFKYEGEIEEDVEIVLSWKGLTGYRGGLTLSTNPDLIYYIHSLGFFQKIDEFVIDFIFADRVETIPVIINQNENNFKPIHDYKTISKDVAYWTYKEIFIDKIYLGSKVKVDRGDLVVDIGSNYGFFASQAKQMGARSIVCYEPSLRLQESLQYNLRNDLAIINRIGVSGESSTSKFKEDLISSASGGISQDEGGYEIDIIGINELIDSIGITIDFLKIDCEGQEVGIFQKIQSDRIGRVKKLVVEYHEEDTEQLIVNKLLSENFIIEEIKNKVIYAYNPKLYRTPKKVALISTFCDTEEKKDVLRETVQRVKDQGIDVMAIGPREIQIPNDIIELCDFFFYTKENPLLKWPYRAYTHWFEFQTPRGVTTMHRGLADYGWAALYQAKKLSQIALTFDYDIFYHMIYDLEIDEVVEEELKNFNVNIIHPRRDPHHPETLWEATLHFMVFDRKTMIDVEKEITLENYQETNGVAEGEVVKWKAKFPIQTSEHPVKDRIFYWENYDFFDYSPHSDFKMFFSKNENTSVWLGYENAYEQFLPDNFKLVFYGFDELNPIKVEINREEFIIEPEAWKIEEFSISSKDVQLFTITYNGTTTDLTDLYHREMRNLIYYNYR